jgi:membrane fusion protein (multidrug efflux system)
MAVREEPVALSIELPGRVVAREVSEVRPQIDGIIRQRLFEEGSYVQKGQLLYVIEDAPYLAAVLAADGRAAEASANIQARRAQADRYDDLVKLDAVSRQEVEAARAAYVQTKASVRAQQGALDAARINLAFTRIRAPISGRIGRSYVTVGALVQSGQPTALATITRTDEVYVDLSQSADEMLDLRDSYDAGDLSRGTAGVADVKLILPNGRPYAQPGNIRFSESIVDPTTGGVAMRALFGNPDGRLLPGMSVRTILPEGTRRGAILVPQSAVTRDEKGAGRALVLGKNNTLEQRAVVADRAVGDRWLVTRGLAVGDRIVVDGLSTARPGLVVTPVSPQRHRQAPPQGASQ